MEENIKTAKKTESMLGCLPKLVNFPRNLNKKRS
jgi:hypothetical protein